VKYHFLTDQGVEFLTQDEADKLAGEDGDYHTRDLFETLAKGEQPSWTLHVQVMPFKEAESYRFNPFDLTKVWPHSDYPLIRVGKLVLDRNPTDHHTEIEQAAFEPNNMIAGIGASPDKMLLARMFAYADAHRHRLGVNYKQIPVNKPQCPVHSYSKDGAMRVTNVQDPVYAPNSKGGPHASGIQEPSEQGWSAGGELLRAPYESRRDDDDTVQPRALIREVMDEAARKRLVSNVAGHLLDGVSGPVLSRAFEYWKKIDQEIGAQIEEKVKNSSNASPK
jgi:catalase